MALLDMAQADLVMQEKALPNADLATNLLWPINNGSDSQKATKNEPPPRPPKQQDGPLFTEFTLDN